MRASTPDECRALFVARQFSPAEQCFAALPPTDNLKLAGAIAYLRVTGLLYRDDFTRAAKVFADLLTQVRAAGRRDTEAWIHNALTWLRWAQDDLDGALRENELVKETIVDSSVPEALQRELLLHYWWDRAYLQLDLALARKSDQAAHAANQARAAYEALARKPDEHDGLAVLAAYFAARRHEGDAARAAAKQVDASQDGDVQDLYVLSLAFDAGGDHEAAAAIRKRIESGNEYPMKPLILRQLKLDAKRAQP